MHYNYYLYVLWVLVTPEGIKIHFWSPDCCAEESIDALSAPTTHFCPDHLKGVFCYYYLLLR